MKEDTDHNRKITENVIQKFTDGFMPGRTKLDTENMIYCKIVLMHLLYNDVQRE